MGIKLTSNKLFIEIVSYKQVWCDWNKLKHWWCSIRGILVDDPQMSKQRCFLVTLKWKWQKVSLERFVRNKERKEKNNVYSGKPNKCEASRSHHHSLRSHQRYLQMSDLDVLFICLETLRYIFRCLYVNVNTPHKSSYNWNVPMKLSHQNANGYG